MENANDENFNIEEKEPNDNREEDNENANNNYQEENVDQQAEENDPNNILNNKINNNDNQNEFVENNNNDNIIVPQNEEEIIQNNNNIKNNNEEESVILDFNTMISKLKKLFEYYCQYGERLNTRILKSFKFIKISKEANIMDNKLNTTRLELIYKTENKYNNMNFNQFLNCLMHIAELKYQNQILVEDNPQLDLKEKIVMLLNDHFLPLYQDIFNENINNINTNKNNDNNVMNNSNISNTSNSLNNTINNIENIDEFLYSKITMEILIHVCPVLFNIYRVYFSNEISISEDIDYIRDTSLKNYFNFIKEFEIAPGLLSKSTCYQAYQSECSNDEVDESISKNREFYMKICKKIDLDSLSKFNHKNQNILGKYFIFFKFVRTLIKLSELTFKKLNFQDLYPCEKLIMFFQKIELSDGFNSFELKTNKTHSDKNSCIVNHDLIEKINSYLEKQKEEDKKLNLNNNNNINNNENKSANNESIYNNNNLIQSSTEYLMNDNYNTEYSNYINETYGEDLLHIFKGICNFGDQFNYQYMKSDKFFKFLNEANLVKINGKTNFGLKLNDIDTLFIKLFLLYKSMNQTEKDSNINKDVNNNLLGTSYSKSDFNHSQRLEESKSNLSLKVNSRRNIFKKKAYKPTQAKIDFNIFIMGLEVISKALFPNIPVKEAIDKVINEHIFPNLSGQFVNKTKSVDEKIEILKELQGNDEYIKVLEITHKAMTPIFKFYTKATNNLMNFQQFMKFAQDFEIFPGIISKAKLNGFFGAISQYSNYDNNDENNNNNNVNNHSVIEQSLFIDILALIANDIIYPEPDPTPVEKILILMEKISGSEGPERITNKTGVNRMMSDDPIGIIEEFKKVYPEYFEVKEHKKETFLDLMAGNQ